MFQGCRDHIARSRDSQGWQQGRFGSGRISTQPYQKLETILNTYSGDTPPPPPNPVDPWNPTYCSQCRKSNKEFLATYAWFILHIHMYKQEATRNIQFHDSTKNKLRSLQKQFSNTRHEFWLKMIYFGSSLGIHCWNPIYLKSNPICIRSPNLKSVEGKLPLHTHPLEPKSMRPWSNTTSLPSLRITEP